VLQNVAINNVADVYTVSERNWLDPWRRIVSASAPREDALTATDDEASVERLLQVANDDGGALSVAVPGAETCQPRRR
jgi:hypothetical protein